VINYFVRRHTHTNCWPNQNSKKKGFKFTQFSSPRVLTTTTMYNIIILTISFYVSSVDYPMLIPLFPPHFFLSFYLCMCVNVPTPFLDIINIKYITSKKSVKCRCFTSRKKNITYCKICNIIT